jgi:hypothetical protein
MPSYTFFRDIRHYFGFNILFIYRVLPVNKTKKKVI